MPQSNLLNWRYLTTSRRYLVYTVGLGLLGLVVIFGVAIPQVGAINDTWAKLDQDRKMAQQLQQKANILTDAMVSPDYVKAPQVDQVLPSKKPLLELLTGLNQVVSENAVVVTNIELTPGLIATQSAGAAGKVVPKSGTAAKDSDTLVVALSVEGTLAQLNDLFTDVEQLAPATTITKLSLSKISRGKTIEPTQRFTADLELSTFYFTKSIASTTGSALPKLDSQGNQVIAELDSFLYPQINLPSSIQGGGLRDLFGITLGSQLEDQLR